MKLLVDRLSGTPSVHRFQADPSWWNARTPASSREGEIVDGLEFELRAHRMGEDLYLEGSVQSALDAQCSRCVARYRQPLRDEFRLVLEPAGDRVPADPESAQALARDGLCLGDDLDAGWYRGAEIRLDAFFAEVVALAMPLKPLCRPDCAGLCARCGADRNAGACDCAETKPESPFAVLAALRGGGNGGPS
jgi:uncharacterized protein